MENVLIVDVLDEQGTGRQGVPAAGHPPLCGTGRQVASLHVLLLCFMQIQKKISEKTILQYIGSECFTIKS